MTQYRTLEAISEIGRLRQYLDRTRESDRVQYLHETASMPASEFPLEEPISGVTARPPEDAYATRRGAHHWTRRRDENGPLRALTDEQAKDARISYRPPVNERVTSIAERLNVTPSTIYGVLNGRTYRRASAGWVDPRGTE